MHVHRSRDPSVRQIQGGAHDAVGVDAVIGVDGVQGACLAKSAHAQRFNWYVIDGGQEGQGVGMPVEDGDHRRSPVGWEDLIEDP